MTTQREIRNVCDVSARLITLIVDTTLTLQQHEGRTLLMGASGAEIDFTLPLAIGSGATFRFMVSIVNTSNYRILCAGSDLFDGTIMVGHVTDGAGGAFAADSNSNIITLNGTTTGGDQIGDWVEVTDILSAQWAVTGIVTASDTEATMFD